MAFYSSRYIL